MTSCVSINHQIGTWGIIAVTLQSAIRETIKVIRLFIVMLVLLFASLTSASEEPTEQNAQGHAFRFRWAICALAKSGDEWKFFPIWQRATLSSGDQLKIFLDLLERCYVYLVHHSSQDTLQLLFPFNVEKFDTDPLEIGQYHIPSRDGWLVLDEYAGTERVYLLASSKRLHCLERLLKEHGQSKAKKPGLEREILSEIRRVRKKKRTFRTQAERPVPTTGRVRLVGELPGPTDVAAQAIEIPAQDLYWRTFIIEHK